MYLPQYPIIAWKSESLPRYTGAVFSYKLRYNVGLGLVKMAISTNPKPTIYRNLYENTSPDVHWLCVPTCKAVCIGSNCKVVYYIEKCIFQSYDEKLFAGPNKVLSEKRKKEVFRKLISGVIGVSYWERYVCLTLTVRD